MFNEQNQATTFLHMNANPEAKVGVGRLLWNGNNWLGVWLLCTMRRRKFYCNMWTMEALCYLCMYVMQPLFEDSMGTGMDPANPIPKGDVLRRLTPWEFQLFYLGFNNWKEDNNPN